MSEHFSMDPSEFGVDPKKIVAIFGTLTDGKVLEDESFQLTTAFDSYQRNQALVAAYYTCQRLRENRLTRSIQSSGIMPQLRLANVQVAVAILEGGQMWYCSADISQNLPEMMFELEYKLKELLNF
jgi:hypothetical protein